MFRAADESGHLRLKKIEKQGQIHAFLIVRLSYLLSTIVEHLKKYSNSREIVFLIIIIKTRKEDTTKKLLYQVKLN